MAKVRYTKEERKQERNERRSERDEDRKERRGARLAKSIAKEDKRMGFNIPKATAKGIVDPGYTNTKPITVLMKQNDGSGNPSVEAYSDKNSQEAVSDAVRNQIDYKASQGEIEPQGGGTDVNFGGGTKGFLAGAQKGYIQSQAKSSPTAGAALISAIGSNSNATITDINKLPDAATVVNNVQAQQDATIASDATNAIDGVQNGTAADATQVGDAINQQEVDNTANQALGAVGGGTTPTTGGADVGATTTTNEPVGGDGQTLNNQIQGGNATFDQGLNKDKVQDQVTNAAFQGFSNSPIVAIEKLGVQDYFPNAGESIAVGSYSGKYIGNTTIFAAPGARVPFGLYDARMRALKAAAAERQQSIDKILSAPQTAEQYQQVFNEWFFSGVEGLRGKYGDDPNAILSSPEGAEFFANANAIARDYTKAVAYAESTLKTYADNDTYLPESMRNKCLEILYATGDDWKKAMNGEGSLINTMKGILSYVNVMPQVEKYANEVLNPDNLTQMPINLRTGGEYEEENFVRDRESFFIKVRSGGIQEGSNEYVEGIRKYFTGDYVKAITALCNAENVSEEQTQDAIRYVEGRIPKESIELKYKSISTNAMELAQLAERRRQFDVNRADRKEKESYARTIHEIGSNGKNPATGKTFNQEVAELKASGATGAELKRKMESLYKLYFGVQDGKISTDGNGTNVTYVPILGGKSEPGDPTKYKFGVSYKDGKEWKYKTLTAAQIASSSEKYYMGGKPISNSDYANIKVKPVNTEVRVAFINSRTGKQEYLKADGSNMDSYLDSAEDKRITYATVQHQIYLRKGGEGNVVTGDLGYYYEPVSGFATGETINIANPAGQQYLDSVIGFTEKQAAEAQGNADTSTTTINSSNE